MILLSPIYEVGLSFGFKIHHLSVLVEEFVGNGSKKLAIALDLTDGYIIDLFVNFIVENFFLEIKTDKWICFLVYFFLLYVLTLKTSK